MNIFCIIFGIYVVFAYTYLCILHCLRLKAKCAAAKMSVQSRFPSLSSDLAGNAFKPGSTAQPKLALNQKFSILNLFDKLYTPMLENEIIKLRKADEDPIRTSMSLHQSRHDIPVPFDRRLISSKDNSLSEKFHNKPEVNNNKSLAEKFDNKPEVNNNKSLAEKFNNKPKVKNSRSLPERFDLLHKLDKDMLAGATTSVRRTKRR